MFVFAEGCSGEAWCVYLKDGSINCIDGAVTTMSIVRGHTRPDEVVLEGTSRLIGNIYAEHSWPDFDSFIDHIRRTDLEDVEP